MKPRHSIRRILPFPTLILASAAMFAGPSAQAAPLTWTGASSNLALDTNWEPNQSPVDTDSFIFGIAGAGGLQLINDLSAGFSVSAITYNAGASAFVIGDGSSSGLGNALVLGGNVINSSTRLQTINCPLSTTSVRTFTTLAGGGDIVLGGNLSGASGGITKAGGGLLTLAGTNTYTAATTVTGGLLRVTGPSTGSVFTVSGGALAGTSSIGGAVTVSASGGINLANGKVGVLALGATLAITGAAGANNLSFDLGTSTADKITVTGNTSVTTAGAAVINLNQIGGVANPIPLGTYPLIQGVGTMAAIGQFALTTTKAFGSGYALSLSGTGKDLQVAVTAGAPGPVAAVWKGGVNTWTTAANWNTAEASNVPAGSAPGYQTNVSFATTTPTAGNLTTNTVDADFEINSLNINATAGGVVLGIVTGSPKMITIDATAANGNPLGNGITSGNTNTIAAKIGLGSSQTWTISGGQLTVSGLVTDFGGGYGLTKTGVGTLVLSGANVYNGPVTVNTGVLNIQHATALGTVLGGTTVTAGAALQMGNITVGLEALTLNGTGISNDGALRSVGGGTYGGLITLGSPTRINTNAGLTLTINNAGTITGPTFGLILGGDGNTTLSSIIGTTSGTLTKDGAGTLILSGANTYAGATTVSVGTLKLGAAGTAPNGPLGTEAAGTTVTSGAVLDLAGFSLSTAEALTLNGNGFLGLGALTNSSTTAATYSGLVALGSSSSIVATSGNILLTHPGTITGAGHGLTLGGTTIGNSISSGIATDTLTKIGAGTWYLSGANTYSGGTTISGGALSFMNTAAKPASGAITVAAGATLGLGVAAANADYFTAANVDALFAGSFAGVTLSATSLVGIDTTAEDFSYDSVIPASTLGLNKLGSGTLTLTGANLYTGPTVVTAGILAVSGAGTLGNSASFNVSGTGTLDLGGTSQTVGPVNITGAATLANGDLTGTSYTASNPSGTATVSANLLGSAGLTMAGAGTLNLTGTNTFSGTTLINGGILKISGAVGTIKASSAIALLNGGNLTLTNTNDTEATVDRAKDSAGISVTNNGTITFTNTASASVYAETLGAVDLVSGQLNVVLATDQNSTGSQALTLSGLTHTGATTAVTFSGATVPNATKNMIKVTGTSAGLIGPWATVGTTAAAQTDYASVDASTNIVPAAIPGSLETTWTGSGNYTSTATANTLTANRSMNSWRYNAAAGALTLGAFKFDTNGILNGSTGLLTISGTGAVRQLGTSAANLFITTGNGGITMTTASIADNTGALTLVKSGSGTLTMGVDNDVTNINSHTGGTIINAGTIALMAQSNKFGTGPLTVNAGATLALSRNTIANNVTLNAGTVTSGNSFTSNINGPVVLGATSTLSVSGGLAIAGNISGPGGLIKAGTLNATVPLTGTNTYTGPTTITTGGLKFGIPASLYNGDTAQWTPANITVANGATLGIKFGVAPDFTSEQVTTLLANLGTANNNGLRSGATVELDTTNGSGARTFDGVLSDSTGPGGGVVNLLKRGVNTLVLTGPSTYSGKTSFYVLAANTSSALSVSSFNSVATNPALGTVHSASSSLGAPTTVANGTIDVGSAGAQGGATLIYIGTGETTDRVLNLTGNASSSCTLDQSGSGLLKFTSALIGNLAGPFNLQGAGNGEIAGGLPPSLGNITKAGSGTWTISGNSLHTGVTTISGGSLVIGGAGQLGTGSHGGSIVISSGANLTYSSSAAQTLAGVISGAGALIQAGPGVLTLAGPSSYTGATTVSAGTLLVNGSTPATSAVTVTDGGKLGGSGTIYGDTSLESGAMALLSTTAPLTFKKLTLNNNVVHLAIPTGLAEGVYTLGYYTNATSSGAFAGIPVIDSGSLAVPGTDMAVTAANGIVNLTVGFPAITISPTTIPNGTPIASYSQALSAAGGYGAPYQNYTIDSGALPDGLSLSADGVISGTPTKLGTFTFGVQVQDQYGFPAGYPTPVAQSYTMSILLPNTFAWRNPVSGDWSDAAKWLNDANVATAPALSGQADYTLNFTPAGTYTTTANLNDGFMVNQLNFAGAVTLAGTNGLALTTSGATPPTINQNSAGMVTINPPLSLAGDLTVGGAGSGQVDLGSVISGAGGLIKSNTGVLKLYGVAPNTYSGGTIVNGGTLHLGTIVAGNSPICTGTVGTGTITLNSGIIEFDRVTESNALIINGGTLFSNNGWGATWSGPITLNAPATLNATWSLTCSGAISGAAGFTKTGVSTLVLSGSNNYAGPTTVSAGVLQVTKPAALYNAVEAAWTAANLTVASGATLRLNVGGASDFSGTQAGLVFANLANSNDNGLKAGAAIGFDTADAGATVVTVSGAIADSSGSSGGMLSLKKFSDGTVKLAGANTYTGQTTLDAGTLSVASFNSVGTPAASSSLGRPTTLANGTIVMGNGGANNNTTLSYTGTGETTDRVLAFVSQNATLSLDQAGTGLLKFTSPVTVGAGYTKVIGLTGSTAGSGELAAAIPSHASLSLTKSGTGTWTLSGVNHYAGTTTINGGTLIIGGAGQLGDGTYASNISLTGVSSTLSYGSTAAQTLSGVISGTGNLAQAGPGTLTLTGINSHGTTTVSGGLLVVNGTSLSDTGKLVLSGSGKVQADAAVEETVDTLFFGDTPQAVGTYSATAGAGVDFVDAVHFAGTGIVKVLTLGSANPYATWASGYLPADVSDPAGDFDGDGMTNGEEYAFALNPTLGSSVSAISSGLSTAGMFSYTRRNPALTGLSYKVFRSLDLVTWTEDATASQTPDSLIADTQTVAVTLTDTAPPIGGKLFVRVVAAP